MTKKEIIYNDINHYNKGTEQFYIMEFYDKSNNFICTKIGKTKQDITERAKQHLAYYKKEVYKIKIIKVYDCGIVPAHVVECGVRWELMKNLKTLKAKGFSNFLNLFIPEDRFIIKIDIQEIDVIVNNIIKYFSE